MVTSVRSPFYHRHTMDYNHPSLDKASMITYSSANTCVIYALHNATLTFSRYVPIIVYLGSYGRYTSLVACFLGIVTGDCENQ